MRPLDPPPPVATFRYRARPRSGNEINRLGVAESGRPRKVFHRAPLIGADDEPAAWKALDFHFNMISGRGGPLFGFGTVLQVMRALAHAPRRRAGGAQAPRRRRSGRHGR